MCDITDDVITTSRPLSPGDYEVSIKFNDEHIPDSPFIVPVATLSDDARRLTITSLQVGGATAASCVCVCTKHQ